MEALATPGSVEQVLDNLISNALAVSRAGQTITIEDDGATREVTLHVRDEGPGMTAQQRSRAFDRFWRAGSLSGGTGLGLAIVHRLVIADGGTVELREAVARRPRRHDHVSGRRPERLAGHDGPTPVNVLRVGLVLVLALVAAVVANLVLLGVATGPNDPVGKLSPRAELIRLPPTTTSPQTTPSPGRTTTITRTTTSPGRTTTITRTTPSPGRTTTRPRGDGGGSGSQPDD